MALSVYHATAKEIIKNSIRSAIFIDDNLAIPFKSNQKTSDVKISRELYNSFTKNSVSIDFLKYNPRRGWAEFKNFIFKGRDLLVLDWQLDNNDIEENTLEILKDAINTPSLHFVCIYTSRNPDEFPSIAYAIKAFFSPYNFEMINQATEQVIDFLDNALPNGLTKEIKERMESFLKEYSLYNSSNKAEKLNKLKDDISKLLGLDVSNNLQRELGRNFRQKIDVAFEMFGYGLNKEFLSEPISSTSLNFFIEKNFIAIDNTIILITNKTNPRPALLYSFFTDAMLRSAGNFLSLLSLDLKAILRDSSGFIGKELDLIDETAFFYHKDTVTPKEAFFDFVLELWKSNLTSLIYSQNHLIKLFDEEKLEKYRKAKKIDGKLKKFRRKGNANVDNDLAKLNYYYNVIENRDANDFVRFGDIFNIIDAEARSTPEYLLCITAHCDCLHVENIKNQFFFVRGVVVDNIKGLLDGDAGNNSFIYNSFKQIICIKWSNKPFTIFLNDNRVLQGTHDFPVGNGIKRVKYTATLKENYAQRIANHAFSHPMRVGIFFAKK